MFSQYRKEFAAALFALAGLAGHFVPGLGDVIDPATIDAAATLLALGALAFLDNRIDGRPVNTVARLATELLIRDGRVTDAIREIESLGRPGAPPPRARTPPADPLADPRAWGGGR